MGNQKASIVKLIIDLTKREISSRYKGSFLGYFWAVFTPLLMLLVYTFVFGMVFKSRWVGFDTSIGDFAIVLFIGMLTYNIFADSVSKAPWMITGNANFVKKVIFPITILPIVGTLTAIFNFCMGFIPWFLITYIYHGLPSITILLLPIYILPIILISLGMSWFISALGVYFKDIGQFIGVVVMLLMFASPVFYPVSSIPEEYRFIFDVNPIASTIEMVRSVSLLSIIPPFEKYIVALLTSLLIALLGYSFFKKLKRGFADVL